LSSSLRRLTRCAVLTALALALGPAFSRSLSGLFAVTLPNARGTGLLATFTGPMDAVKARGVLAAWAVLTGGAMVAADVRTGLAALVGAGPGLHRRRVCVGLAGLQFEKPPGGVLVDVV